MTFGSQQTKDALIGAGYVAGVESSVLTAAAGCGCCTKLMQDASLFDGMDSAISTAW